VKGLGVTPGLTDTVDGMIVHFCCSPCIAKYRANPAAYGPALRADPAVAKRMDEAKARREPAAAAPAPAQAPDPRGLALHDAMRGLWKDHVVWTRLFLVSELAGLPDRDAAMARLLRNQEDIGGAIAPYYGVEAGTKLTSLLKDHVTTAAELVGAMKAEDAAKVEASKKAWFANADGIAALLHRANPAACPLEHATSMMRKHLDLTTAQIAARIKGDWSGDAAACDAACEHAMEMADRLSDGIRHTFPEKLK
jgi:hypothetical protein